jgi:hypothetical protein
LDEALRRVSVLRQLTGIGKIPAAVTWVEHFLASKPLEKLIIFAHHIEVQQQLQAAFSDALVIDGKTSAAARRKAVKTFQAEGGPRLIICSLAADNYLGRLSDNYDGRYDCPLGPDVKRGGAPTGDRPQRAAA